MRRATRLRHPSQFVYFLKQPDDIGTYTDFPGSRDGLVFLWHNTLEGSGDLEPRGEARISEDGQMDLTGGAFLTKDVNDTLLAACQASNQLTLECLVTTDNLDQSGPARIISFSNDSTHRNFTLGQNGNRYAVRIRTPRGPERMARVVNSLSVKSNRESLYTSSSVILTEVSTATSMVSLSTSATQSKGISAIGNPIRCFSVMKQVVVGIGKVNSAVWRFTADSSVWKKLHISLD